MDLIADIGGTHARFVLVRNKDEFSDLQVFRRQDYAGFAAALEAYLETVGNPQIESLAVAWAALIGNGEVRLLQDNDWAFAREDIVARFSLKRLQVVNDTQAVALSLPALAPADLQPLTKTNPLPQATKLALTVGTGFGTATAIWTGEKWLALAGEGGHALMPMSHHARGNAVLQDLQQRLGVVTIANVVSGVGMRNLYDSIARLEGKEGTPIPEAEAIAAAARAGDESVAVETMRLFLESLAAVTYNFAMTTLAVGGVYLTGGVAARLGPLIEVDDYLKRSFAEIPFPVALVTRENPAFLGLAQLL